MPPRTSPPEVGTSRSPSSPGGRPARGRRARVAALAAIALALGGCLEYSPHAVPQDGADRDVHRKSLERLLASPAPDVLRFAVVGDTQGDFDEAEEVVAQVNARDDLSFVVQVGDFTHLGLAPEFTAMNAIFRRLRVPYFVAVGNHDLLANGGDVYDSMFGARNLAFTYGRTRFVLFDANAVEYGFDGTIPDLALLAGALADREAYDEAILFSHIGPNNSDWDPAVREPFLAFVSELGVKASFHGHAHDPGESEHDGSIFYVAGAVDRRSFIIASVHPDGRIEVERRGF
jgi:predicted phosphodiesterase